MFFIVVNNLTGLTFKEEVYYFINNIKQKHKCLHCGSDVKFKGTLSKGYGDFCSLKCANQKVRGCALPKPENELIGNQKHRKICFRYHKKECIICKEDKIVAVHHMNEDHEDNRIENLRFLCPNCHSQTDTFCKNRIKEVSYCGCGKQKYRKSKVCIDCRNNRGKNGAIV